MMQKTPETCSEANLQKKYSFTISGNTTPMLPGQIPHTVSAKGTLDVAENGSVEVESDCSVTFELKLPVPDGQAAEPEPLKMRGFLVNGGNEILAFQTDPGAMVAAHLTADAR